MAKSKKIYDVFISYAARDRTLAKEIADACRAASMNAWMDLEFLESHQNGGDAIREALVESQALLTVLSPSGPTPWMEIAIGGALAWNKPIYAVVTEPTSTRLPPILSGIHPYPTSRIPDVIHAIAISAQQFSDADRSLLTRLYADLKVPVDQLDLDSGPLDDMTKKFNKSSKKVVSGDRLLSELLRLRKQGKLPKLRPVGRSRSHSDTV